MSLYNTKRYEHMTGAGTVITRSGTATLHKVTVNTSGSTTLTIYDNYAASGDVVAVVDCGANGSFDYGLPLNTGLTVTLAGTADVTVIYQ